MAEFSVDSEDKPLDGMGTSWYTGHRIQFSETGPVVAVWDKGTITRTYRCSRAELTLIRDWAEEFLSKEPK